MVCHVDGSERQYNRYDSRPDHLGLPMAIGMIFIGGSLETRIELRAAPVATTSPALCTPSATSTGLPNNIPTESLTAVNATLLIKLSQIAIDDCLFSLTTNSLLP